MKVANEISEQNGVFGCPSDWSFLPLKQELRRIVGKNGVKVGNTQALSHLLVEQQIDTAVCSTVTLLSNPHFELAGPAGLSFNGESSWCYFGLNNDIGNLLEEIQPRIIALKALFLKARMTESSSIKSVADCISQSCFRGEAIPKGTPPKIRFLSTGGSEYVLARLLYKMIWGETAFKTNEMICSASSQSVGSYPGISLDFLSKNDALQRRVNYSKTIDLIKLWNDITGLPFVSAVWQKVRCPNRAARKHTIINASERAQATMRIEPSTYIPPLIPIAGIDQEIDLAQLWKTQVYKLGPTEIKSLLMFLQLSLPLERKYLDQESFTIKMLRWQERGLES